MVDAPERLSTMRIGTIGLMISSSAETRFLIAVAPSQISVFPLGRIASVATVPSGGRSCVFGIVVSLEAASLGVFFGALGTGGVLPWRIV